MKLSRAVGVLAAMIIAAATASPGSGQGIPVLPGRQGRLRADRIRYDARAQVLVAEGHVSLTIDALMVAASRLRLEQKTLVVVAEGATVRDRGLVLQAPTVRYEITSQVLRAGDGVAVTRGGSALTARTVLADLRAKRVEASGGAHLVRPASPAPAAGGERVEEVDLRAPRLQLRWDPAEVRAEGGVTVRQGGVVARAERAQYAETGERLELTGAVVVEQFGGDAGAPTTLAAERLTVSLRARDMDAAGTVVVSQKGRTATGERARYTHAIKRIVLTGRVRMQDEDGSVLRADVVVVSLADDTFEASGNVETVFTVTRGK